MDIETMLADFDWTSVESCDHYDRAVVWAEDADEVDA